MTYKLLDARPDWSDPEKGVTTGTIVKEWWDYAAEGNYDKAREEIGTALDHYFYTDSSNPLKPSTHPWHDAGMETAIQSIPDSFFISIKGYEKNNGEHIREGFISTWDALEAAKNHSATSAIYDALDNLISTVFVYYDFGIEIDLSKEDVSLDPENGDVSIAAEVYYNDGSTILKTKLAIPYTPFEQSTQTTKHYKHLQLVTTDDGGKSIAWAPYDKTQSFLDASNNFMILKNELIFPPDFSSVENILYASEIAKKYPEEEVIDKIGFKLPYSVEIDLGNYFSSSTDRPLGKIRFFVIGANHDVEQENPDNKIGLTFIAYYTLKTAFSLDISGDDFLFGGIGFSGLVEDDFYIFNYRFNQNYEELYRNTKIPYKEYSCWDMDTNEQWVEAEGVFSEYGPFFLLSASELNAKPFDSWSNYYTLNEGTPYGYFVNGYINFQYWDNATSYAWTRSLVFDRDKDNSYVNFGYLKQYTNRLFNAPNDWKTYDTEMGVLLAFCV